MIEIADFSETSLKCCAYTWRYILEDTVFCYLLLNSNNEVQLWDEVGSLLYGRYCLIVTTFRMVLRLSERPTENCGRSASLTRGSWALFPPATETLLTDSRAVLCCPENGRLKFEGLSSLKSDNPRQSPIIVVIITKCYNGIIRLWRRVQENRKFLWGPSLLRSSRPG